MRDTLLVLGIVCAILGFIVHNLWYVAIPSLVLSFLVSPSGRRPDGQKHLPGPLGWILDEIIISIKMKDCPHCGYKVMKKDKVCLFCKKEIDPDLEKKEDSENILSDENPENQDHGKEENH